MSELNEEEADAFFRSGDAGTYEGGPAVSLAPVVAPELFDEPHPRSAEHLARRHKLKRVVTAVVGSLGAGLLLVGVFRLARVDDATAVIPASAPATVSEPPTPRELATEHGTAPAIADPPAPAPEPLSVATPPAAPSSLDDRAARSTPRRTRAGRARIMVAHVAWGPAGVARRSRLGAGHVPPTATFPDVHH